MGIFQKNKHILCGEQNGILKPDVVLQSQKKEEVIEGQTEYPVLEREILPEKVICPDCGGLTTEGMDFCELCGGELEPSEDRKNN